MTTQARKSDARVHDIQMCDRGLLGNVVDTQLIRCIDQEFYNRLRPVGSIAQQSKITQRLLGTTQFALLLAEFVREFDENFAVAMPLVLR
jgi:hypothetical protein